MTPRSTILAGLFVVVFAGSPALAEAAGDAGLGASAADESVLLAVGAAGAGLTAAMFTRLAAEDLLLHPLRDLIMGQVKADPGITFAELVRELGSPPGTVAHHVRVLEDHGLIEAHRVGKFTRYYPGGTPPSHLTPTQEKVLDALRENPDASQAEVARSLGMSKQRVSYALKTLVKDRPNLLE